LRNKVGKIAPGKRRRTCQWSGKQAADSVIRRLVPLNPQTAQAPLSQQHRIGEQLQLTARALQVGYGFPSLADKPTWTNPELFVLKKKLFP